MHKNAYLLSLRGQSMLRVDMSSQSTFRLTYLLTLRQRIEFRPSISPTASVNSFSTTLELSSTNATAMLKLNDKVPSTTLVFFFFLFLFFFVFFYFFCFDWPQRIGLKFLLKRLRNRNNRLQITHRFTPNQKLFSYFGFRLLLLRTFHLTSS